jgi:hypothetical protein
MYIFIVRSFIINYEKTRTAFTDEHNIKAHRFVQALDTEERQAHQHKE